MEYGNTGKRDLECASTGKKALSIDETWKSNSADKESSDDSMFLTPPTSPVTQIHEEQVLQ